MDPKLAVALGLGVLDAALKLITELRAQSGMSPEEILAHADTLDLANREAIKVLLAM